LKIYTKGGDSGKSSLLSGKRELKTHIRFEANGTVDELNALIGLIVDIDEIKSEKIVLEQLQNDLFLIGSIISDDRKVEDRIPFNTDKILLIEHTIDTLDSKLPKLTNFILPSGSKDIAMAHLARTVCRRAERRIVELNGIEGGFAEILMYMNRLSDLLFVMARYICLKSNIEEKKWKM
jgi:cob(I)alamin adenosyltransferase